MRVEELTPRILRVWSAEWYTRLDFLTWLNHPLTATWRQRLTPVHPREEADAFTWLEDQEDGSDVPCPGDLGPGGQGLPPDIWQELVAAADGRFPVMVWISQEIVVDPEVDEPVAYQHELEDDEFADLALPIHFKCDD